MTRMDLSIFSIALEWWWARSEEEKMVLVYGCSNKNTYS